MTSFIYWTFSICMMLMAASLGLGYLAYNYFERREE